MTLPDLNLTTTAGLMAAAALIGGAWHRIWSFLVSVSDIFICRATVKDDAAKAILSYVWANGRRSPFSVRVFGGTRTFVRPQKRIELVGYEAIGRDPMLFFMGRIPVIIKSGGDTSEGYDEKGRMAAIWCFRWTLDLDELIETAINAFNQLTSVHAEQERQIKRFNVFRVGGSITKEEGRSPWSNAVSPKSLPPAAEGESSYDIFKRLRQKELRLITWKPEDLIEQTNEQPPFDLYPFSDKSLSILSEIETWLKHEQWFRSKGVPHRRGYSLYGPTGTGKSTFVRSIAIRYDLPLYVFDLATMTNGEFASEWRAVQSNTPAIILLEDLDAIFSGRTNLVTQGKQREGLTFDCLLNTISGVGSSEGVLLFITTNHIESLDPALGIPVDGSSKSSRPGRIDKVLHFGPMEEAQRRKLAEFILSDFPAEIEATVEAGEGETAAQFQERCAQLALSRFWTDGVINDATAPIRPEKVVVPITKWKGDKMIGESTQVYTVEEYEELEKRNQKFLEKFYAETQRTL